MDEVRKQRSWRAAIVVVVIGTAYALCSQLAYTWFDANGVNASFFPAAGVTVAALALLPRRSWRYVLIGAGLAELGIDIAHDLSVQSAVGYCVANLLQPVVAASIITAGGRHPDLARVGSLARFIAGAVVVGPLVGGVVGAATHVVLGSGTDGLTFAGEWWVGDGLGALVVGGSLIGLRATRPSSLSVSGRAEQVGLLIAITVATYLAFRFNLAPLGFLILVLIFLLAARGDIRSVSLCALAVAVIAAEGTSRGHRLWRSLDIADSTGLLYLQLILIVVTASALAMCTALSEREIATIAFADLKAAEREAVLAQRRAELLGRVAEDLGRAAGPADVRAALERHHLQDAWPSSDAHARGTTGADSQHALADAARRMAIDALERVRLIGHERQARERAELLERHAARLAGAASPRAVALATVEDLHALDPGSASVWLVDGATLREGWRDRNDDLDDDPDDDPDRAIDMDADSPIAECARTGRTLWVVDRADLIHRWADLRAIGDDVSSLVAVPLGTRGGVALGTMVVTSADRGWLSSVRRQVLAGIADQCGLALERARLQERVMRDAAEAALLARLGDTIERATTARDRAQRVVDELMAHDAGAMVIEMVEGGHRTVLAAANAGVDLEAPATVELPLQARGRMLGSISMWAGERTLQLEPRLLADIAARTGIAIDNAMLYERERDISHRLQLGLLDVQYPTVSGFHIDAAYRPGTATLDIGGDWYDAFMLPSGALALVVGDVVGHGLDAAIAMSQLRGAVRALAGLSSPSELLDRLDVFVDGIPAAEMTTLVYVEVDPRSGRLRYACAGHPPPLVVSATGVSRFLWGARSTPLGSGFGARRVETIDRLDQGERLVLYTDGLVERRGERLDDGLDRLMACSMHDAASADFVDRSIDALLEGSVQSDDICVLALTRVHEGSFMRSFPPTLGAAAAARRELGLWLTEHGASASERADVVLAVGEAVANAVEHGGGPHGTAPRAGGAIVISCTPAGDALSIVVRDHGRWLEPTPSAARGRGLMIMRAVMREIAIERHDDGTLVRMLTHPFAQGVAPAASDPTQQEQRQRV